MKVVFILFLIYHEISVTLKKTINIDEFHEVIELNAPFNTKLLRSPY